jgi:hypothetical protein
MYCALHRANSPIDMPIRTSLQTLGEGIVLIMADVLTRLPQKIKRLMQPAGMIGQLIDRRMVFQVLTVFNRSLLDLIDRRIDPPDAFDLIPGLNPVTRTMLDHPTRGPQIGQRVQIIRMLTKRRGVASDIFPHAACRICRDSTCRIGLLRTEDTQTRQDADVEKTLDFHLHFHVERF